MSESIVIVDDEVAILNSLSPILGTKDIKSRSCKSGGEALRNYHGGATGSDVAGYLDAGDGWPGNTQARA